LDIFFDYQKQYTVTMWGLSMSKDKKGKDEDKLLYCSFCGKSQNEVRKLIAGP